VEYPEKENGGVWTPPSKIVAPASRSYRRRLEEGMRKEWTRMEGGKVRKWWRLDGMGLLRQVREPG
jgi:hypothetical protein